MKKVVGVLAIVLAVLLVGPQAGWITGQTIKVDGGLAGIKPPPSMSPARAEHVRA